MKLALIAAVAFVDLWYGRIAAAPSDGQASVYWEGARDARGKRFDPRKVSCAHRTERFETLLVVTNTANGKKVVCPVWDRGPHLKGRVIDLTPPAARAIGCDGLCNVTVRRLGFE